MLLSPAGNFVAKPLRELGLLSVCEFQDRGRLQYEGPDEGKNGCPGHVNHYRMEGCARSEADKLTNIALVVNFDYEFTNGKRGTWGGVWD